jgi:hypothetical protein
MHSRIIALRRTNCEELSRYKQYHSGTLEIPLPGDYEELNEYNLDFDRVADFADYISDIPSVNHQENIEWVANTIAKDCLRVEKNKTYKYNVYYLDIKMSDIKNCIKRNIKQASEKFSTDIDKFVENNYAIRSAIVGHFGFHVVNTTREQSISNSSLETLDEWIYDLYTEFKDLTKDDTVLTFRVEGIIDYHY